MTIYLKNMLQEILRVMVSLSYPPSSSLEVKFSLFGREEMRLGVMMFLVYNFAMCTVISRNQNLFLMTFLTPEIYHHF